MNPSPIPVARVRERLESGCAQLGQPLTSDQIERLIRFLQILARWNRAYNLTAVRDPEAMVSYHLLDSLSVAPFLFGDRILDMGTGAGLPGIPLGICHPDRRFILVDSNGKKVRFVRQACSALGLGNLVVVQARLESFRAPVPCTTVLSRAVARMARLMALAEPLIARPGRLLAMKGRYPEEELREVRTRSPLIHRLSVPFLEAQRHLIEIRFGEEPSPTGFSSRHRPPGSPD